MGEQIRIFDVVRHLIGLAGYMPDHNIKIDVSASLARDLMSN
jgi:FlaA1/EpsC-like NDP-sugar epimerase